MNSSHSIPTPPATGSAIVDATAAIEKIQNAEKTLAAEKESLRRQCAALVASRRPFFEMVDRWRKLRYLIEATEPRLAAMQTEATAFRESLHRVFIADAIETPPNWVPWVLKFVSNNCAIGVATTAAIPILTDWLAARHTELAQHEASLIDYARVNSLVEDLPTELQAASRGDGSMSIE